ncbi:hypothetical protein [Streptomyces sp. NPDC055105]|uniref:hypothetical protein n=1 Tax=Streptomyces sp. NPDC055105 TaxID=3365719 RepID=UPI0037D1831A
MALALAGLVLVPAGAAATTAGAAAGAKAPRAVGLTRTFPFTGAPESFTLPANATSTVTADGAGGYNGGDGNSAITTGSAGGGEASP